MGRLERLVRPSTPGRYDSGWYRPSLVRRVRIAIADWLDIRAVNAAMRRFR